MKLRIGYPDQAHEREMLRAAVTRNSATGHPAGPAIDPAALHAVQQEVMAVAVCSAVQDYLVSLAGATRSHPRVTLGLSPRGLLIWQRVAQAWALMHRRDFVIPDDVQDVALPVLEVRLGVEAESAVPIVSETLAAVPVPVLPEELE
jgi:MoxR-like ATPase